MIQLHISELTAGDRPVCLALSRMFAELADSGLTVTGEAPDALAARVAGMHPGLSMPYGQPLAPADNPSTGAPEGDEVFGVSDSGNTFGTGAALPNGVPVPSTAGAGPSSIAPAALMSTSTLPAIAPSPVAPLPVPEAATVVNPAPAGGLVLDADGLPWDMRINSSPAKINDGDKKWKAKRGVSGVLVAQVQAELRLALSAGNAAPPVPAVTAAPVPAPASLSSAATPVVLPLPLLDTVVTPVPAGNVTMATIMARVMAGIAAHTITAEAANDLAKTVSDGKVSTFVMLAVVPALLPVYAKHLTELGIA
jgi:hypothetical protein